MTLNRHEEFDELISGSLSGDLTTTERQSLDTHLAGCARCRDTLTAFRDQRLAIAGLRHQPAPRDLDARVRTGIERGRFARSPWWRRPAFIFGGVGGGLAAITGALLAFVILNGSDGGLPVGNASPTPTPIDTLPSASPSISLSPRPTTSALASPGVSSVPSPTAAPIEVSPEPDVFLALTGPFDNQALTIRDGESGDTLIEADTPAGPPIAAEISPDGRWLTYITQLGESGLNEVRATLVADPSSGSNPVIGLGDTVLLGRSEAGSPFLEQLTWSDDSESMAFTIRDPDTGETDAWVFDATEAAAQPLTDVGNAYAGSWVAGAGSSELLWVSIAGETPRSYLMSVSPDGAAITPADPADSPYPPAENVFQPLLTPNDRLVIFWAGRMEQSGSDWLFVEGGAPWLAESSGDGAGGYEFVDARRLFSDLSIGRDAFASAAIAWGSDGDALAVWDVAWTGISQGPSGELYPDPSAVYFGHAADSRGLTRLHAIDEADLADDARAVDVKVAPTGRHLVISAARPRDGVLDAATADLLLITRNTGSLADVVRVLGSADRGWFGPGVFAARGSAEGP